MGIYLPNMEMPKNCCGCVFSAYTPTGKIPYCKRTGKDLTADVYFNKRDSSCPLVPVPPHGRLGDLDKLERMFADIDNAPYSGFDGEEPFYSADDAAQIIRLAPTIIPADPEEEEMK